MIKMLRNQQPHQKNEQLCKKMNNLIMKGKNLYKNKSGEKFGFGLLIIFLVVTVSLFAFISEDSRITGFAAISTEPSIVVISNDLMEFNDFKSLQTLSAGNYYVDNEGIVYWIDDESMPAIAKVKSIDEIQKNRIIYIDAQGRIGYVLNSVLINENE